MPRTVPPCKTCDQNAKAWEAAAIKLWETHMELLMTQDALNEARFQLNDLHDNVAQMVHEVEKCRRDHTR